MSWPPVVAEFKVRFDRDFTYAAGKDSVRDTDIQNALNDAVALFNQSLWSSDTEKRTSYLFLTAHLMILNIQAAGGATARNLGKGVKNTGGGVMQSKGVGSISVSYTIPERIANSPALNHFMRTDYGQRYLAMLYPRITGPVSIAHGPGICDEGASPI